MPPSFADHLSLLSAFLDRRDLVVDAIERQILNAQNKELSRSRDRGPLERLLTGCFSATFELPRQLAGLHGTLAAAHAADGFEPLARDEYSHRLDPVELVGRAYVHWHATRWPGRNGRMTCAHLVYGAFMLGQLEHLSLQIWDGEDPAANLRDVQRLLDRLNADASSPAFIRDARWLIQTAQGPLTRELAPYFRVAARIAGTLEPDHRLEVHKAGVALAGGHLRSQQRYRAAETGLAFDDPAVLAITRNSNSMDVALLVGDLVPLLERYEAAMSERNEDLRRTLASFILQGLSADPELLITRFDLLAAASSIEEVFLDATVPDGPGHTAAGERHIAIIQRYRELLDRLAPALIGDCLDLDPAQHAYSPLGISYGFCADILWNVALTMLTVRSSSSLVLEDLFESRTRLDEKAALAGTWQRLPTQPEERAYFTHSPEWAQQVFLATIDRLRQRASGNPIPRSGRIFVRPAGETIEPSTRTVPDGAVDAQEHVITSDIQRALSSGATAFPKSHIVSDRKEGRYLASVEEDGKWFAVSKVLLTACLAQGRDAVISDVPASLVDRLRLLCPGIVMLS